MFFHKATAIQVDKANPSGGVFTKPGFTFVNNIFAHNSYAFFGDNAGGIDQIAVNAYFPATLVTKNIIMGQRSPTDTRDWSSNFSNLPGNFFPKDWSGVFNNQAGGDYTIKAGSVYKNAGTDGKDLGADIFAINNLTAGVIAGTSGGSPSPTPTPTPTPTPVIGDINLDRIVNTIDYSILNSHWFTNNSQSDLNHDGVVNSIDYSLLNQNWFRTW
jgi:hypothetical protein